MTNLLLTLKCISGFAYLIFSIILFRKNILLLLLYLKHVIKLLGYNLGCYSPSDDKVCLFLEDLELRASIISIKNLLPRLVYLLLFYGRRKGIRFARRVDDFFP